MNNDLISREALKEEIRNNKKVAGRFIEGVIMLIDNAPTVDITEEQAIDKLHKTGWLPMHDKEMTERPQGEWIYDERLNNWKCSECGETPKTIGYVGNTDFMKEHFKFCNHCGANMRKGGAE